MTRRLPQRKHKVKRFETLDRRRGYVSPSPTDEICPHFQQEFLLLEQADMTDDYCAMCSYHGAQNICDYRDPTFLHHKDIVLCYRYWKHFLTPEEFVRLIPIDQKEQHLNVTYHYIRKFGIRKASVEAKLYLKGHNIKGDLTFDQLEVIGTEVWEQTEFNGKPAIKTKQNIAASMKLFHDLTGSEGHVTNLSFHAKSYVSPSQNDGDYLGIIFRYTPNNYYQLYWDGGDNGATLRVVHVKNGKKQLLYSHGVHWQKGVEYSYDVTIQGNTISYIVKRVSNGAVLGSGSFQDIYSNGYGSFGIYTESQQDAYWYDLKYTADANITLTKQQEPYLDMNVNLQLVDDQLSQEIGSYFVHIINAIRNRYPNYEIEKVEYHLMSTDLPEQAYFNKSGNTVTTDPTDTITIEEHTYDIPYIKQFQLDIPIEKPPTLHTEIFDKNITLTKIEVSADAIQFHDAFQVMVDNQIIYEETHVSKEYFKKELEYYIQPNIPIVFRYNSHSEPYRVYKGVYIDTHNKRYKVEDHQVGWFQEPIIVTEEEYEKQITEKELGE